ncbi:MAG: MotA/TolQ/ExbB proton channel family protein [Pseudomonadota bacterium]
MSQALEWLRLGGPAMLILLGLSIASVTLILVKAWEFWELKIGQRDFVAGALNAWHAGRADEALALLNSQVTPLAKVMAAAIKGRSNTALPESEVREQITQLASEHLESARRLLRPLEVIANLAPLLGLLGTVLGMIQVFQRLQTAGDRVNPSILSGGLWEALLTTAAGLTVAIIALAGFHVLDRAVERLHHDMEGALTRIFTRPL